MPAVQPEKLKPCPACGTKKLRVFAWDEETRYGGCLRPGCRMSGPLGATNEAAAKAWNSLPRQAPNAGVTGAELAKRPR